MVKDLIENAFPRQLLIQGQVADFRGTYSSGHMYFTLRDDRGASIRAVIWASAAQRIKFQPQNGLEVVVSAFVTVYAIGGQYQLNIQRIEPLRIGALALQFEQTKQKLLAEGLLDPERKRPLPVHPRGIGVVTAQTGAVIRDIIKTTALRDHRVNIVLRPAKVQGDGAAEEVIAGIRELNQHREALGIDLLIVGRGGGSADDLWAFNDETLAREIAASELPVISAVGHETDVSIADMVADVRASTPTAAAMLAIPVPLEEMRDGVGEAQQRLTYAMTRYLRWLEDRLERARLRIAPHEPTRRLQDEMQRLDQLQARLEQSWRNAISSRSQQLSGLAGRLEALSPLQVLSRGYAIAQRADGSVLRSAAKANIGEEISVRLHEGRIVAEIRARMPEDRSP